jgi:hypothetical protein
VHNKYTGADFDEDLRSVLRRAGCRDEKVAFILDESNVLDSGFLERMNTLLANGEVGSIFINKIIDLTIKALVSWIMNIVIYLTFNYQANDP